MSVLAEQLRRLARQAGARVPAATDAPSPPRVADADLRRLLAQRSQRLSRGIDRALPGEEIAPGLRYLEVRLSLPMPSHLHWNDPRHGARTFDARRLLHFDTETTGLAGGTGTRAFMIGAADWHDGGLRIRQLALSALSGEAAMLDAFAAWVEADTVLVSYNGKCYDAPLLAARHRLARRRNPLEGLDHLDLLHAVRRRFRGTWENCRLATVERRWLGIVRDDDLPGAQAPRAFLDYVRGGAATDLRRVFAHNRQDVVTLARLLERLAQPPGDAVRALR